jgi:hypothetical protein
LLVRIPDTSDVNTILTRLRKQNRELHTSDWSVMSRKAIKKEQTLAFWGLGRIIFRTLKEKKKEPEAESTSNKSAPQ